LVVQGNLILALPAANEAVSNERGPRQGQLFSFGG
jgi:hypothetical protein